MAAGWPGSPRSDGLLTPHNDIVPEDEYRAMAPEGVSVHAARREEFGGLIDVRARAAWTKVLELLLGFPEVDRNLRKLDARQR